MTFTLFDTSARFSTLSQWFPRLDNNYDLLARGALLSTAISKDVPKLLAAPPVVNRHVMAPGLASPGAPPCSTLMNLVAQLPALFCTRARRRSGGKSSMGSRREFLGILIGLRFDANALLVRAFGVPGLGYKRGLAEDLVITPYASLLALPIDPSAVVDNLADLVKLGMQGTYGLYEAVDFTPSRLLLGDSYEIVRSMSHHQGMICVLGELFDQGAWSIAFMPTRWSKASSCCRSRSPDPPGRPTRGGRVRPNSPK
jgi:hypothetical protein